MFTTANINVTCIFYSCTFFFVLRTELQMSYEGTPILWKIILLKISSFYNDVNLRKIEVGRMDVFIKKTTMCM